MGLSVHGRYRVCTERTVFAMPETGIGLIPDVGGGHFLPRMNGQLGMFFALTGHRIKGADCLHAGVATHGCHSSKIADLREELAGVKDASDIGDLLASYTEDFVKEAKPFSLADKGQVIDLCFAEDSVENILVALKRDGSEWSSKLAANMRTMSPTSMKVTFR